VGGNFSVGAGLPGPLLASALQPADKVAVMANITKPWLKYMEEKLYTVC